MKEELKQLGFHINFSTMSLILNEKSHIYYFIPSEQFALNTAGIIQLLNISDIKELQTLIKILKK